MPALTDYYVYLSKLAMLDFKVSAQLALIAGLSTAAPLVHGQPQALPSGSLDPSAPFQINRVQSQSQTTNLQAPGLAPLINTQGGFTDLQGQSYLRRKLLDSPQSSNLTLSNAFVWSDNRGIWKSEPPAPTCMLQATSADNVQPC